jgi:hypothetical protein
MAIKLDTDTLEARGLRLGQSKTSTIRCRARFSAKNLLRSEAKRREKVKLALKLWVAITVSSFTLSEADAGAQ